MPGNLKHLLGRKQGLRKNCRGLLRGGVDAGIRQTCREPILGFCFVLLCGQPSSFQNKSWLDGDGSSSTGESFCPRPSAWLASKLTAHSSHCFLWSVYASWFPPAPLHRVSLWETRSWVSPEWKAAPPFRTTSGTFPFGKSVLTLMSKSR